jgi:phosphoenolpyruvate synthase/pyruvate phosphate dikinase
VTVERGKIRRQEVLLLNTNSTLYSLPITPDMADGTAVNICTMVFGNMGFDSATGVAFTRDPGTGENVLYGEYLVNAQGEDVVAVNGYKSKAVNHSDPITELVATKIYMKKNM